MNVYAAIALCFIPVVTVFILFLILIPGFKIRLELLSVLLGLVALLPIAVVQFWVGEAEIFNRWNFGLLLFRALILYGLIEEGFKCAVLFLFPVKKVNLKEMFFYGLLAGIVLGGFESVIYVLHTIQTATNHGGEVLLHMIYLRSFTSIVIHGFCAGLLAMFVFTVRKNKVFMAPAFYAVVIHGIYDFFSIMNFPMNYFAYVSILLLLLECRISYKRIKAMNLEEA
ncbi:MAG: PrsW family glutamic-type intramembrane protease [Treponema sp.]|nr:PrsW family glutamic-type intramembrane protease [Treponema sp.]